MVSCVQVTSTKRTTAPHQYISSIKKLMKLNTILSVRMEGNDLAALKELAYQKRTTVSGLVQSSLRNKIKQGKELLK